MACECVRWNEKRISREPPSDVAVVALIGVKHRREKFIGRDRAELRAVDIGPRGRPSDAVLTRVGVASRRRTTRLSV